MVLVVKNLPASTGDVRDVGWFPGSGSRLEEGRATHSSVPSWRVPWAEKPGGLHPVVAHAITHGRSDVAVTDACCLVILPELLFLFFHHSRNRY